MLNHLIKSIQETKIKDVTIQANNGKVSTTKLILASWSNFWKETLIDFDDSEDVLILIDVDKLILNKIYMFLTTGKVAISGPQENIDVIKGLEMLLPDLELSDQQKLTIEDTESNDEETDTDFDKFTFDVKENYICNICLTYFRDKYTRDNHIKNMHLSTKRFSCKVCDKVLNSKDGLVTHMKSHTRSSTYQCHCKKIFKNKSDYLKHCKSKGHSYLDNQKRKQKQKRKFKCTECDFTTNRVDSLYRHERNVHGIYNKRLDAISETLAKRGEVKCSKCDKKFTDSKLAKDHFTRESCELIKCEDCGKEFNKRADLLLHTRDVHGENEFPCPSCDKVFKQSRNMKRHHNKCKLKNQKQRKSSK